MRRRYIACLSLSGAFLYIIIFYPGFMSADSVTQLLQGRSGVFSDWHPPVMAYLWGEVDKIYRGPFGMLVLQTSLVWLGFYLTSKNYFTGKYRLWFCSLLFLLLFSPQVFGIAGAIWKDNLMWGTLFLSIGLSGLIVPPKQGEKIISIICLCLIIFFLTFAASLRINAVFAVTGVAVLAVYKIIPNDLKRKSILSLVLGIGLSLIILFVSVFISRSLTSLEQHSWISVAIFDVAGVIVHLEDPKAKKEIFERIPIQIRRDSPLIELEKSYTPRYWLKLFKKGGGPLNRPPGGFGELSEDEVDVLKQIWFDSVVNYPIAYMEHRWAAFRHVIGLDGNSWSFSFMKTNGYKKEQFKEFEGNREQTKLQNMLESGLNSLSNYLIFRPWLYLLMSFCLVIYSIFFLKNDAFYIIIIPLSGIAHELALFFLAPSADYRYSHYMVFTFLLSATFLGNMIVVNRAEK